MDLSLPIASPVRYRVPWRAVVAATLSVVLLGGGWLWLRDSSLVAVNQVRISGLRGPQAGQIEALLRSTARGMTTLDFDDRELRSAVVAFPVVAAVRASTGFPHTVRISVTERLPVATLLAGGQRTALAADGTALGAQLASSSLPTLTGSFAPTPGQRVSDASVRSQVAVLAAVPSVLARFVERAYDGPEGLTVAMRNGLLVYFGDSSRPHAKWLSLAGVLADPSSAGARYVDVRVPERPAAGLAGSATVTVPSNPTPAQSTGSGSAAATLAERLERGAGGVSSASAAPAAESSTTLSETPAPSSAESSTTPSETPAPSSAESSTTLSEPQAKSSGESEPSG